MLGKRVASAVVGIPIIIYVIWLGGAWYASLIGLIAILGIHEYIKMLDLKSWILQIYSYVAVIALIASIYFEQLIITFALIWLIFLITALHLLFGFKSTGIAELTSVFWGLFYVGGLLSYLVSIRVYFNYKFTILIFVVIWLNDTAAYFIGKKWGKNKLSPTVSPNKTVEGALGGLLVPLAFVLILHPVIGTHYPLTLGWTIIFTVGISIIAQVGDLVESAIKRKLSTKDSGGIIPGHGGILDRFDGILFAAPFAHYFLLVAQRYIMFFD